MQADRSSARPRPVRRLSALTKKTKSIATSPGKSVSPAKTGTSKTGTAKTGTAKTSTTKTSTAKTGTAKMDAARTVAAKTSTTKTGVAKTSAAKTGAVKTSAAKAGSAKTDLMGTTKTGHTGSGVAKTTTAKTSATKTDTVKAGAARPGVTKAAATSSPGNRTKVAKAAKADVAGRSSKTATKAMPPAKDMEPMRVAEGQKKDNDKDKDREKEEIKEDKAKENEIKGDEVKMDDVKGDEEVEGDAVKGDGVKGDEDKGDEVKVDEVKGDEIKGDEVKGGEVKGDEVKGDKGKGKVEDKIQEDDDTKEVSEKVKAKGKERKNRKQKGRKGRKEPESFDDFMEEGVRLEEQGERYVTGEKAKRYYEQAIAMYEQAHELKPKDANSLYNWGRVLYILSNMDMGRSWAQHKTDLLTESIQKFRETLALDHDNADAMYNLAHALSSMADIIQDADEEHGVELASDALAETIQLYDRVYELQQKELHMAAQLADTASESASSSISAISSSKDIEVMSTASDTESYFEAEPISPTVLVETLIASSQALSAMGTLVESLEEAEEHFNHAIEKLEQAAALGEVGTEDEIQHQWANLYAAQADRVFQATGSVHQVQRLYELALRKLETVAEHDLDNVEVMCDRGDLVLEYVETLLQAREGNETKILELFDMATQSFLDALRFEPNNASILQKLGSIHLARTAGLEEDQYDLYDKALDYYKRALDVQKDDFEGYLFYALALSQVPCRSDEELDLCLHEFKQRGGSARFVHEWCDANQELLKTSATADTFIPRLLEICESPDA